MLLFSLQRSSHQEVEPRRALVGTWQTFVESPFLATYVRMVFSADSSYAMQYLHDGKWEAMSAGLYSFSNPYLHVQPKIAPLCWRAYQGYEERVVFSAENHLRLQGSTWMRIEGGAGS